MYNLYTKTQLRLNFLDTKDMVATLADIKELPNAYSL